MMKKQTFSHKVFQILLIAVIVLQLGLVEFSPLSTSIAAGAASSQVNLSSGPTTLNAMGTGTSNTLVLRSDGTSLGWSESSSGQIDLLAIRRHRRKPKG